MDEIEHLLNADNILPADATRAALAGLPSTSQITYMLWDTKAEGGWLSDSRATVMDASEAARPLYLGKSAGLSRLRAHLAKDGFGSGHTKVTAHAWKNPGLLSYCLTKRQIGWLGVTFVNHGVGPAADQASEALESAAVQRLGWRRDLEQLRKANKFDDVESLTAFYAPIHADRVPLGEGLLLNQTDPRPDGRKRRFF